MAAEDLVTEGQVAALVTEVAGAIPRIVEISQAAYDALSPPTAGTLYLVTS